VPLIWNTADSRKKCPGYCKQQLGEGWGFTWHWWGDQNDKSRSICVCGRKVCNTPEPTPSPTPQPTTKPTPSPTPLCKNVQKGISVPLIWNTADSKKKCPGYCKEQLGEGWGFTWHWWHDQQNKLRSICVCGKRICAPSPDTAADRRLEFEADADFDFEIDETLEETDFEAQSTEELEATLRSLETIEDFCVFAAADPEYDLCDSPCATIDSIIHEFIPEGMLGVCSGTDLLIRDMCIAECSE